MPWIAILQIVKNYWKPLAIIAIIALVYFYGYSSGYKSATNKTDKEHAEEVALQLKVQQSKEQELINLRNRYYILDANYEKAVKSDKNYQCVVPDSLRMYLNSI